MEEHNAAAMEKLYQQLLGLGAVRTTSEFSIEWLGMQHSYLRCLRDRNKSPSTKAWATLSVRLRHASQSLAQNEHPKVRKTSKYFRQLSDRCIDEIVAAGERSICVSQK